MLEKVGIWRYAQQASVSCMAVLSDAAVLLTALADLFARGTKQ